MGARVKGKALLLWAVDGNSATPLNYHWLDTQTLKTTPIKAEGLPFTRSGDTLFVQASTDGSCYGIWAPFIQRGICSLVVDGDAVNVHYDDNPKTAAAIPGANGKFLATGTGVVSADLKR